MKITVVGVGKIREPFFRDALAEYGKRLGRYCKLQLLEVGDEPAPQRASPAQEDGVREREAARILGRLPEDGYVIALDMGGRRLDSVSFSQKLTELGLSGKSHITFVIGGSLGLHASLKERADLLLSFSDMTFPHQLMRVILLEQIYRAFKIMNGEPYHK